MHNQSCCLPYSGPALQQRGPPPTHPGIQQQPSTILLTPSCLNCCLTRAGFSRNLHCSTRAAGFLNFLHIELLNHCRLCQTPKTTSQQHPQPSRSSRNPLKPLHRRSSGCKGAPCCQSGYAQLRQCTTHSQTAAWPPGRQVGSTRAKQRGRPPGWRTARLAARCTASKVGTLEELAPACWCSSVVYGLHTCQ